MEHFSERDERDELWIPHSLEYRIKAHLQIIPLFITISICETVRTGTVLAIVANVSYVDRQDISCLCHVIVKMVLPGINKEVNYGI